MNKLKRTIAKRRRLNNIAYHASRNTLTADQRQAIKALPVVIKDGKRIKVKPCLD